MAVGVTLGLAACAPAGVDGYVVVLQGGVADVDGLPIEGAAVDLLDPLGATLGSTESDARGAWVWPILGSAPDDNAVRAAVSAPGYGEGLAHWEVSLLSAEVVDLGAGPGQTWDPVERPLACVRLAGAEETPTARGRVVDPDGSPVSGVAGVLQRGWDAEVGDAAAASFVTDGNGRFEAAVDTPGLYTASIAPSGGWAGARFPVLTTVDSEEMVGTLALPQEPGRLYAVLRWTGNLDLDLHLTAPERDADAANALVRLHVWADEPVHESRTQGDITAEMVRTSTTGTAPEIVAVHTPLGAGELRLSVHDRTNSAEADSASLGASRALVQWWYGEDTPRYAWVDPRARATTWRPVELDTRGATLYAVERYASGVDPADPDAF